MNAIFQASGIDGRRKGACIFCQVTIFYIKSNIKIFTYLTPVKLETKHFFSKIFNIQGESKKQTWIIDIFAKILEILVLFGFRKNKM